MSEEDDHKKEREEAFEAFLEFSRFAAENPEIMREFKMIGEGDKEGAKASVRRRMLSDYAAFEKKVRRTDKVAWCTCWGYGLFALWRFYGAIGQDAFNCVVNFACCLFFIYFGTAVYRVIYRSTRKRLVLRQTTFDSIKMLHDKIDQIFS